MDILAGLIIGVILTLVLTKRGITINFTTKDLTEHKIEMPEYDDAALRKIEDERTTQITDALNKLNSFMTGEEEE